MRNPNNPPTNTSFIECTLESTLDWATMSAMIKLSVIAMVESDR